MTDKEREESNIADLRERLLHREAEIDLLQQTFAEIGSELGLEKVFQVVADRARELVKAETLLIPILDPDCEGYTYQAGSGANADEIVGTTLPLEFGVCGWVWKHKRAWWQGVLDELGDEERNRWERDAGSLGDLLVPEVQLIDVSQLGVIHQSTDN